MPALRGKLVWAYHTFGGALAAVQRALRRLVLHAVLAGLRKFDYV
jgi:hypothetical protein